MDIYSVKLPSQVPAELRARADKVEAEINASSKNKMDRRSRGREGFNNKDEENDRETEEQMLDEDASKVTVQKSSYSALDKDNSVSQDLRNPS